MDQTVKIKPELNTCNSKCTSLKRNTPVRIPPYGKYPGKSADELKKVRYWIDCGDDDFLTKGNCLLHIMLTDKKVPHKYCVRDSAHNWTYWRTGIVDALQFIGAGFHQQ